MTIQELHDLISEKLNTGEFHTMDIVYVCGVDEDSDWVPIQEVVNQGFGHLTIMVNAVLDECYVPGVM